MGVVMELGNGGNGSGEDRAPRIDHLEPQAQVLSKIMLEGELFDTVLAQGVTAVHFQKPAFRVIFEAMQSLADQRIAISPGAVRLELDRQGTLDAAGGGLALSDLVMLTATTEGIEFYAAAMREQAETKRVRSQLRPALVEHLPVEVLGPRLVRMGEELQEVSGTRTEALKTGANTIGGVVMTEYPPRVSYWGQGLLPAGYVVVLAGDAGIGKTFWTVDTLCHIAAGRERSGFATIQARVGLLELECDEGDLKPRIVACLDGLGIAPTDPVCQNFIVRCYPKRLNVLKDGNDKLVENFIRDMDLKVLAIDSLERTHGGRENDDIIPLIDKLNEIAACTGCVILLLHHSSKATDNKNDTRSDHLKAVRGSTVVTAVAKTVMHLYGCKRDPAYTVLSWGKTNFGATPSDRYYLAAPSGLLEDADEPENPRVKMGQENAKKVREIIEGAGAAGITTQDGCKLVGIVRTTWNQHARAVGAICIGGRGNLGGRWVLPSGPAPDLF